jgi:hypothetical protein
MAYHLDLLDARRMEEKCTFDAHAVGNATNGEIAVDAAATQAHDYTLERL